MIVGLGRQEAEEILTERSDIEVGCEFCGAQYRFDPVDAAQLFVAPVQIVSSGGEGAH
jgi:molecular chaperone Hsp33